MFKNMLKNITYFPTFKDFDKPVNGKKIKIYYKYKCLF